MDKDNIRSQMRKGILELCVLRFLQGREAYPSDIIRALSQSRLVVVEGTIYTLLNRLRREGRLDYEWRESRQGPPRKYFFLTPAGEATLAALNAEWEELQRTVNFFTTHEITEERNEENV